MKRMKIAALIGLLAAAGVADASDQGQVSSVLSRVGERVYAVRIVSIDGRNLPAGGRQLVRLDPGKRKLGVVALIERDNSFNMRDHRRPNSKYIEIDVEAGKQYRIGAKVEDPRYEAWTTVIEFR